MLVDIFDEEPQDEVAVFLEEKIFAAVTAVGVGTVEMLGPVEFDGNSLIGAQQVDFHVSPAAEGNGQLLVEVKQTGGFRQGLKAVGYRQPQRKIIRFRVNPDACFGNSPLTGPAGPGRSLRVRG